jgi:hypothetical protein
VLDLLDKSTAGTAKAILPFRLPERLLMQLTQPVGEPSPTNSIDAEVLKQFLNEKVNLAKCDPISNFNQSEP